jgi:hypothetical protein
MNPPDYDQVCAACEEGDLEALQRWFPDDPTQWRSSGGSSLLHWVVQTPHVPVLNWLLTFPMDVNESNYYGTTPLMWTCLYQNEAMARRLLTQEADLQATDLKGRRCTTRVLTTGWTGWSCCYSMERTPRLKPIKKIFQKTYCPCPVPTTQPFAPCWRTPGTGVGSSKTRFCAPKKGTGPPWLHRVPKKKLFLLFPQWIQTTNSCTTRVGGETWPRCNRVFPHGPAEWKDDQGCSLLHWVVVC